MAATFMKIEDDEHMRQMTSKYGDESGMAYVGKLLTLNVNSAQSNIEEQNIEASNEIEVSYGETSCSFGISYNDHNYACPLGLSPPSSPPYLRDFKYVLSLRNSLMTASKDKVVSDEGFVSMAPSNRHMLGVYNDVEDLGGLTKSAHYPSGLSQFAFDDPRVVQMISACKIIEVNNKDGMDDDKFANLDLGDNDPEIEDRRRESLRILVEPSSQNSPEGSSLAVNSDLADMSSSNKHYAPSPNGHTHVQKHRRQEALAQMYAHPPLSWIRRALPRCLLYKIHCICSLNNPDEAMVVCGKCGCVQHFDCMIEPQSRIVKLPTYLCEYCYQRPVNNKRATLLQSLKRKKEPVPAEWLHETRLPTLHHLTAVSALRGTQNLPKVPPVKVSGNNNRGQHEHLEGNDYVDSPNDSSSNENVTIRYQSPRASKRKQDFTKPPCVTYEVVNTEPACLANTDAGSISADKHQVVHTLVAGGKFTTVNMPRTQYCSPGRRSRRSRILAKSAEDTWIRGRSMDTPTNPLGSAWMKDYTHIECNLYSDSVLQFVRELRNNPAAPVFNYLPRVSVKKPMCRIILLDHNFKGLESTSRLLRGDIIIEYRGKAMMKDEYNIIKDQMGEFNRYVFFYPFLEQSVTIAIDAAECGNDARYIRRSCRSNCEMKHTFVGDDIHFYIVASHETSPSVELTLPFDYDYTSCPHSVDCACGTSRCPVQRWIRSVQTRRAMPKVDYSKYIKHQLQALSRPLFEVETSHALTSKPLLNQSQSVMSHEEYRSDSVGISDPQIDSVLVEGVDTLYRNDETDQYNFPKTERKESMPFIPITTTRRRKDEVLIPADKYLPFDN